MLFASGDNSINGTESDDYILGSNGNDSINGLAGEDIIAASNGNDQIDGGGKEYDQVDYEGSLADYQFVRNDDGSITASKPDGSTDNLLNIDGFWFSEEAKWYSVDEVLNANQDYNTIIGTDGDDYILGSSGDDVINLLQGSDVAQWSDGNDFIIGDASSYDQVDYAGQKEDYSFSLDADNRIEVIKPNGDIDLLESIEGFWFEENSEWVYYTDLVPVS